MPVPSSHNKWRCARLLTDGVVHAQVALQPAAPGAAVPLPAASMRLMTSVAAAWAAQGFQEQELLENTVAGSRSLPEASRSSLLQSLLALFPSVSLTVMHHRSYGSKDGRPLFWAMQSSFCMHHCRL